MKLGGGRFGRCGRQADVFGVDGLKRLFTGDFLEIFPGVGDDEFDAAAEVEVDFERLGLLNDEGIAGLQATGEDGQPSNRCKGDGSHRIDARLDVHRDSWGLDTIRRETLEAGGFYLTIPGFASSNFRHRWRGGGCWAGFDRVGRFGNP